MDQDVSLMLGPELFAVTGFSVFNINSSRLRVVDDLFLQFSILRQTALHILDLRGKLIKPGSRDLGLCLKVLIAHIPMLFQVSHGFAKEKA